MDGVDRMSILLRPPKPKGQRVGWIDGIRGKGDRGIWRMGEREIWRGGDLEIGGFGSNPIIVDTRFIASH
jgi:hypothetical protein